MPLVPASFFGMALGLAGLAGAWRAAHRLWGLPAIVGEAVMLAAALVWAVVLAVYAAKWVWAPADARREAADPVQCCFIGLAGVATMLVGMGALPYSRPAAVGLFGAGALFTLAFAVWRTGGLWQGGREPGATTPVLYLPTVAGSFVTATGAAALGWPEWGRLAFGAGLFSWLAVESVLLHRLYTAESLPEPLRPTLGLQPAPPAVGAVAYLAVADTGPPGLAVQALLGYALLQALVLLRLLRWLRAGRPFAPSYWSFSFGGTALSTALLLTAERSGAAAGPAALLAGPVFVAANALLAALVAGTVRLGLRGRLLPRLAAG